MTKISMLIMLVLGMGSFGTKPTEFIARQGQVSFFSYTSVENIEATNNQVLSIIDFNTHEIAVSMLMNAFVFKKSLMQEHFNESYIESDLFPKATLQGKIIDFDPSGSGIQTRMIKGTLNLRGIDKNIEVKTTIENKDGKYLLVGDFEVAVKDFNINIPPILMPNISKTIAVKFSFEYQSYEK